MFNELVKFDFMKKTNKTTTTYSTIYEDNHGSLELAREPKHSPRTKCVSLKDRHFRWKVAKGTIIINSIDTSNQQADIFTKPLPKVQFEKLRKLIIGW